MEKIYYCRKKKENNIFINNIKLNIKNALKVQNKPKNANRNIRKLVKLRILTKIGKLRRIILI